MLGRRGVAEHDVEIRFGLRHARSDDGVVLPAFVKTVDLPNAGEGEQRDDDEHDHMADDPARLEDEAVHGAASVCDIDAP